ncbi:Calx-beta domain-containing protein [Gimesia chilikensis]|uniref:Calx-beta domain-containing protein n=1 Tax=Gimesia chilikensis TaxID=2605989 RepID=UPI00118D0E36|nr:Calx-beta domain-containing protein [Gimesia chilikensis]QDT84056.1 Calx-beta domain protein [Gimesia chilikensis]
MLLTNWLQSFVHRYTPNRTSQRSKRLRRRPESQRIRHLKSRSVKSIEQLEDRTLLTSLLTIDDVSIVEGDSGTSTASITVTRTGSSAGDLNHLALVSFTTQDGTATAAEGDYIASSGTLAFTADPTELSQTQVINVQINGDTLTETDETFQLLLTGSSSALTTIADNSGLITISNNDSTSLSISDASAPENETLTFNVSLSEVAGADITFRVNTQTGTANHSDYTFLSDQLVTIKAGDLSTDVTVYVHDDANQESDEAFSVLISDPRIGGGTPSGSVLISDYYATGTIVNEDHLAGSVFILDDHYISEGDNGSRNLVLRVGRTGGSAGDLNFATTVDISTINGTATAGEDYSSVNSTVSFSASATSTLQYKSVFIPIHGDLFKEATETFKVRLSNPTGGSVLKGNLATLEATVSIQNDDTALSFQNELFADEEYANFTYDEFGSAIAMDGDVMVVGVPKNSAHADRSGAVYVYRRNQQGTPADETDDTWELETTLFSDSIVTDSYQGTEFGYSVDIEDDTIVVGSQREGGKGAAYVFTRVGSDWKTQPPLVEKFDVSGTYSTYLFGVSVSVSQDTIVVGARSDNSGISSGGAAYIFEKSGVDWSAPVITQLLPADPTSNKYYGASVSVEGELLVVGALNDTHSSGTYSGSAYIYTRNGSDWHTIAPTETKITASDGSAYAYYGSSVSTNGTEIAIAARSARHTDGTGTVYLYQKNGTDWSTVAPDEYKFTNQEEGNFFGTSLLLRDDQLVVGESGAAYVYNKSGATWDPGTVVESVLTKSTSEYSNFGKSVASSGTTVAAGAPTLSLDGNNSGEVFVFQENSPGTWNIISELNQIDTDTAHNVGDEFGKIISMDDQYMLIVAPGTDSTLAPAGVLYVYAKNDQGTTSVVDDTWDYETSFTAPDAVNTVSFADSVAIDGSTFLVSATLAGGIAEVYIYERNGNDWTTVAPTVTPLLTHVSRTLNGQTAVAIEEQTIVIGNQDATGNATQSGAVYVYEQNGSDWTTVAPTETVLTASDGTTGDAFGSGVDIQGDRIIVGAPEADNRGAAYLFQRGTTGWSSAIETRLTGSRLQTGDKFGTIVLIDQGTVAITAPEYDGSTSNEGAVYLYDSRNGWDNLTETFLSSTDGNSYNYFGTSIDLDNNTLIVGTDRYSAYLYENLSGWDPLNVSKLYYDSSSELYNLGLGEVVALNSYSLAVANLYNESTTISSVYSYNQQSPTFSIDDASITENDNGTQTLNLTVSVTDIPDGLYNQPISVDFSTVDGSATTADNDYQPLTGTLYFDEDSPLATQSQTISILINGDTKVELAETFAVTLSNPSVASDLSQGTATVTINDNDTVNLSISDVVVNEADGTATVTVTLDQPVPGNLSIDYATSQGTAIAGTDYSATSGTLSFSAGQQSQTITVDIIEDALAELEDSFDIILSNLQSTGFNASLLDNTGTVTIQDNDRLYNFEFKSKFQAQGTISDGDHLGNDMAIDGDTMIVGAPFWEDVTNQGAAFIYVRNRQGTHDDLSDDTWEYQATLLAPDPAFLARFGFTVAISGDTAVVGAISGDDGVIGSGSVYVFTRSGTNWTLQQELTASDAVSNDSFSEKLAIDGDTIVVGTVRNNSYTGAAYVFQRDNGVWSEVTKLTASDAVTGQQFGNAIEIEGSTLVIGAYRDSEYLSQSGAVYIFQKFGGNWVETQKLKSSQIVPNGFFGSSLSLEGENLVVGNPATFVTAPYSGKAYLFTLDTDTGIWSETQTLTPDDGNANAYFGYRVEIKNNLLVISSLRDADTATNNGKVYTFVKQGATWVQSQKFISPDAADDDYFGKAFAVTDGALLVSAYYDDEGADNTGSIYYYAPQAPAITVSDAVITEGDNGSRFVSLEVTRTAVTAGDLLLPATVDFTTTDGTATAAGNDYLASSGTLTFNGDPTVLTQTKIITIEIPGDRIVELDAEFSVTLSNLTGYGRLDDDTAQITIEDNDQATISINDVIVNEAAGKARLTVVLDAPVSTTVTLDYTTVDQSATATNDYLSQTGSLTFTPGELSQIIEIDLVDSTPVELPETFLVQLSNLQAGGLDVFLPDDLATVTIKDDDIGDYELKSQIYSIGSRHPDDHFGFSLAVDGDTLISSAPGWDATYSDQGGAFIYVRNDQGTPEYTGDDTWEYQATLLAPDADNNTSDRFGHVVAISGDTAVVAALYGDETAENAGSVFVFTRSNGIWSFQQELHVADTIGNGYFGDVVAIENDTIVVGARSTDVYTGSAYVFKRENNVWTQTAKLVANDAAPVANFGSSVDIENSTIVIGARLDSETEYRSGAVYIFNEQDGNWTQTQKLKDPTPVDQGTFGTSVSLEGDLLLVGAISIPGQPASAGKAILFQLDHNSGLWNPIQTLTASDAAADSLFGVSVKIQDHQIFISSSSDPTGVLYNGAVYLFQQENQTWVEQQKFSDPSPTTGINFGRNLAVSNDTILIAAKYDDDYSPNAGSIYVYGLPQNPTISIEDASVTETDNGSHMVTLTVTRTATKPGDLIYGATVDFRTIDGLATIVGGDYENTTGTITFASEPTATSQTQTISIRVFGDLLVEADETFGIELFNVTGHARISDAEATITIQDDDQAALTIDDISINENAGTATLTVSLDQPVDTAISVDYATADLSAVSPDDYTATSGTLTFNPGVLSREIIVSITDTDLVELDEKLLVNLSGLQTNGRDVVIADSQGEITIQDDDQAGFQVADLAVDENVGTAFVVITLDKPIDTAIDVTYITMEINTTEGLDYVYANGSITFNPGELSKTVPVSIIDSALVEADERFSFSIGVLDNKGRDIIISDGYAEITIHDDDQARFSINDISVDEDAGTATLTVTLDEQVSGTVQVDYYTTSQSASSPTDFQSSSGTLSFSSGVSTQTISIPIIDSDLVELDESFLVSLTNIRPAYNIIFTDSQGQVTIQDDDQAAITINDISVDEDAGTAILIVSLDQPVDTAISVDYATADLSAISPDDYTATSGTLTFNPEEQLKIITIPITDTDLVEGSESLLVNLSNLQAVGRNVILSDTQGSVTITDDDQAGISIADISVDENAGIATLTVSLDHPVDTVINLDYNTAAQSAALNDDFLGTSGTLTFNPGEQTREIQVAIVDSALVEGDESFLVGLSGLQVNGRNVIISRNQAVVTIQDDDQATLSINNAIVDEDAGTATLTVWLDQPVATTVTVNYTTVNASAHSPDDFHAKSGLLTFYPGDLSKTITVSIIDSELVELDEFLLVNLSNIQAGTADVVFSDSQGQIITIQDDDQANISINDVSVNEDANTATLTVTLDVAVDTAISVNYSTADQTALESQDYQPTSGMLTFNSGELSKSITIPIVDSNLVEIDEKLLVNLSGLQAFGRNVVISDSQGEITIEDDDQAAITIDDVTVDEDAGTATLTVSLDNPIDSTITVDYTTVDQTAVSPDDYTTAAGTLTFNPGVQSQSITVSIIDTDLVELNESLLVNLSGLQANGRDVVITDSQGEITIQDDDQARILLNDLTVNEDVGNAQVIVTLDQPVDTSITVNYSLYDRSTNDSDDFIGQFTVNTITFNPGEVQKTISIPIVDSANVETTESFYLILSGLEASGRDVLIPEDTIEVTILDDDQARISINDVTVDEDAGTAMLTVTLDQLVDGQISIDYTTSDQTAGSPEDYQATSGTLIINSRDLSGTFTIPIIDSDLVEIDENFLVTLSNIQAPNLNVVFDDAQGQITIQDDDQASITIDDVTIDEDAGFAILTVSLDKEVDTAISVNYATADQTAVSSEDYQTRSGTLTFNPGQSTRTITVPLIYAGLLEPEETFVVNLTNLQNQGRNVIIGDSQGVVTIINHPPDSVFSITGDQLFFEGDSGTRNVRFVITRTGSIAGDLNFASSVSFTTADGTATAGEDYTPKTYTFNFSASPTALEQTASTLVSVNADTIKELSETILGRLTNPTGGSTLAGDVAVLDGTAVLINDDSDFSFNQDFLTPPDFSNHTRDRLGDDAIAIDGDVMVVGSSLNSASGEDNGAVYIYIRNEQGTPADQSDDTWEYATSILPDMSQLTNYSVGARFGTSVAIDGDTIVIGARQASFNNYHTGAVFVYTRVGSDWKTAAPEMEILADPINTNAVYFGDAVSIYENTIVVGVPGDSSGASSGGAAYIYEKNGSNWSTADVRKLIPSDSAANTDFGVAVSIYDDLIVVGDSRNGANGTNSGAAYVYTRSGDNWIDSPPIEVKLTASDASSNTYFGGSVSTNGSEIVVGSHQAHEFGTGTGAAYLYSRNGADWNSLPPDEIKLTGSAAYDYFGTSVSLSDQQLVVGSPGAGDAGSIFIYSKGGADWDTSTMTVTMESINSTESLSFGDTVAISGSTIAAGVPGISRDGIESGAVFVYQSSAPDTWTLASELSPTDSQTAHNVGDFFGESIVTSDQYMLISAPRSDSPLSPEGVVFLYTRNDAGTPADKNDDFWEYTTALTAPDPEQTRLFGETFAIDGSTILINAIMDDSTAEVYIYEMNGSDWTTTAPTVTPLLSRLARSIPQDSITANTALAIQGDTIAVSGTVATGNTPSSGAVYVYTRNGSDWSTSLPTESILAASDGSAQDHFGYSIDLDGDKLVVGAEAKQNRGGAYLYEKGVTGWDSAIETILDASDLQTGDRYGSSVAIDGNTIAVSAPYHSGANEKSGAVYLFDGSGGWTNPSEIKLTQADQNSYFLFGSSLALDGNLLAVGTNKTSVFLFDGSAGWDLDHETKLSYPASSDLLGLGFGATVALNNNNLVVAALYNEYDNRGNVFSFNRQVPTFSIDNATITENDNGTQTLQLTVTATGIIPGLHADPISLDIDTLSGSALAGSDFLAYSGTILFDNNAASSTQTKTISIDIIGDTNVEATETFSVVISNPSVEASLIQDTGTVTIADNDVATFQISNRTVNENNGTVVIPVILDKSVQTTITVNYTTVSQTADSPDDYLTTFGTLTFNPGEQLKNISIPLVDNGVVEVDEEFLVTLSGIQSNGHQVVFTDDQALVTIQDDDQAAISINDTSIDEDAGTVTLTVSMDHPVDTTVTIDYETSIQTAVAPEDFQNTSGTLTFNPGEQSKTITIPIVDSDRVELDETFLVTLSALQASGRNVIISDPQALVTIRDDDQAAMTIDDVTIAEDAGTVILTVSLDQPVDTAVTVDYATADQTAGAPDDYQNTTGTLTFNLGEKRKTITIPIVDSDLVELNETFLVTLSALQASGRDVSITDSQAQVTIQDNDQAAISIDDVTVDEDAGTVTLTISLDQPVDTNVNIDYATSDLTAGVPDDYQSISGTRTFNPGEQSKTITIPIVDSNTIELDEYFLVSLSALQAGGRNVIITGSLAQVIIQDDDQAAISIDDVTIAEDAGTVTLTVSMDQPVDTSVTVNYATSDQSAGAPDDYQTTTGTLTFNPGELSKTITIPIIDSNIIELDETFLVSLSGLQAGGRDVIITDSQAQVTIQDDDQAAITINDMTVDEDAGTATLTVSIDQPIDTTVTVDYTTSDQSAGAPDDYQTTTGTLTFNPRELSQTITIPIVDSNLVELDETFLVTLSALQASGRDVSISDSEAQVTIQDDDQAAMTIDDVTVDEDAGTATLTVSLDQPVDTTMTVNYATSDQTAGAPDDYQNTTGTLTFNPGELSKTITIPIVDSPLIEAHETLLVNLSGMQSAGRNVILTDSQGQVTIRDDDRVTAELHLRIVSQPSNTTSAGEVLTLPAGRDWVDEWSTYWVEIWVDALNPTSQGIFSTSLDFSYQTQYTSASEIEFGGAFTQNQTGLIDDASGIISNLHAETTETQRGSDRYLLFARIKFAPAGEDQVLLDLENKSIGPYDLEFEINTPQVTLVDDIALDTVPAAFAGTEIWANPYDLNDDNRINFRDLLLFASVYNSIPSQSDSDYAWFADLNQNDRVEFKDLLLFASNYNKTREGRDQVNYASSYPEVWNNLLTVESQAEPPLIVEPLKQTTAQSMLDSAVDEVSSQVSSVESQKLESINIQVTDLAGDTLGRAAGNTIYIDSNAAGYGWFIDATPTSHDEFTESSDLTLIALPDSDAAERVDLWSVIMHELGHLLGYDHEESGWMEDSLIPGVRKLPAWENNADQFFSDLSDDMSIIL